MIIPCAKCKNPFSIENRFVKEANGQAICPYCETINLVSEVKAYCGNPDCKELFKYKDYELDFKNPQVNCPACGAVNRVKLRPNVLVRLKKSTV
jgi:DNA-directed RNA polymerase subunit RPC12/RpoP